MPDIHDPFRVEKRKPLTPKQRLKLFLDRKGMCCVCGLKIMQNERWIDEHVAPLWLNGTNDLDNRGVAHERCASKKTSAEAKTRAKVRRVAQRHMGARKPKSIVPGSRASKWKKKVDGTVVRRDEE
jgi:5-methylcytosine-specific restriction protein A